MKKIVIIDDDPIIRKQLTKLLNLCGYTVLSAEDGEEGLNVVEKEEPALVLLDIKMPGIDGIEVLKRIKKRTDKVEVIMITGHGAIENAIEALKEGACNFVTKPFDPDKLEVDIKVAIDKFDIKRQLEREQANLKIHAVKLEKAYKDLKETQNKLIQSEKLATIGRFAAGVAHEINNPMVSMLLNVQDLLSELSNENFKDEKDYVYFDKSLKKAELGIHRCKKIVASLLSFSKPPKIQHIDTDINKVVHSTVDVLDALLTSKNVEIKFDLNDSLPIIKADGDRLAQVFTNLMVNATHAMGENPCIKLKSSLLPPDDYASKGYVTVSITDNGKGMSQDTINKIFDPFFTTKESCQGVGLGLSISYGIIQEHKGSIDVTSEVGVGTTFTIKIPV